MSRFFMKIRYFPSGENVDSDPLSSFLLSVDGGNDPVSRHTDPEDIKIIELYKRLDPDDLETRFPGFEPAISSWRGQEAGSKN